MKSRIRKKMAKQQTKAQLKRENDLLRELNIYATQQGSLAAEKAARLESHSKQLAEERDAFSKQWLDLYNQRQDEQWSGESAAKQTECVRIKRSIWYKTKASLTAATKDAEQARAEAELAADKVTYLAAIARAAAEDAEKYSQELVQARAERDKAQSELKWWKCEVRTPKEVQDTINWLQAEGQKHDDTFDYSRFMELTGMLLTHCTALEERAKRMYDEWHTATLKGPDLGLQLSAAHKTAEGLREALAPIVKLAELTARHKDEMGLWHQSDSHGPSFTLTIGDIRKIAALAQSSASSTTEAREEKS